ncbi:hypothetical protein QR680_008269 [Steinernema hermaphroditum]|uniref:C2H2-type domain-containing protein n=1 Tax=Steinernema hermaphroditum TaxID=289476 RepID=A0AA39II28_9BILA|nr:hypothetical protein QR680_008269 [Steinernema hermaphroditum]
MVCSTAPSSSHSLSADSVVYNYVKRKKPQLLLEMFGKERCGELEGKDHLYDRNAFLSALQTVRVDLEKKERVSFKAEKKRVTCDVPSMRTKPPMDDGSVLARPNADTTQEPKKMKETVLSKTVQEESASVMPKRPNVKITSELAVFNYFYERQQKEALQLLFDEEVREDYGRKVEAMGIWIPSVARIYAWYRYVGLKKVVKNTAEMWKCRLCTKLLKAKGRSNFLSHIGIHENIPCPCVVDECDAIFRSPLHLPVHLQKKHVLFINNLTAKQYHQMTTMRKDFYRKAKAFRDKYFPPESFVGFNDCKTKDTTRDFEDPKCQECGAMITSAMSRRRHVAKHLNLSYKCVFDGCETKGWPSTLPTHFYRKHSRKSSDLSEEQLFKYKRMKVDFIKVMKEAVPKYFLYKVNATEDGLLE